MTDPERAKRREMVSVVYEAPNSIGEAVRLLKESEIPARVLSRRNRSYNPKQLTEDQSRLIVDVKKIDGMLDAKFSKEGLELGPLNVLRRAHGPRRH